MLLMFQTEDQIDEILDEGMDEFDQELHLPKELQTDDTWMNWTKKKCKELAVWENTGQKEKNKIADNFLTFIRKDVGHF